MLVRGLEAVSLGVTSGSAFTKKCRPSSSTILAIWQLAPFAKKDAKKIAQSASVVLISPAVIAVRFIIRLFTPARPPSCLGEGDNGSCNLLQNQQFSTLTFCGQCSFRTRAPYRAVYPEEIAGRVARLATPRLRDELLSPERHGSTASTIIPRPRSGTGRSPRPI